MLIGVFYQLIAGKIGGERLQEIIHYLNETINDSDEIKKIIKVFYTWGAENGLNFSEQNLYDG